MSRLFIHNPFFRICAGPIAGVMVYLLILLINNTITEVDEIYNHDELYVCIALSYISFESMRLTIILLDRFALRLVATRVVITTVVSLGLVAASISIYFHWIVGFSIGVHELNIFLIVFGFGSLLYNILYFSHFYLQQENKSELELENKLRDKVESDFLSFRNDINPDLLYESLENLILTLHHDADQAEEQIDSLAGIYRYSLINRQKELVRLQEELTAVQNLLHLLEYKHPKSIQFKSTVAEPDNIHLIPGSLIITIDTIVRNTLLSPASPADIRLYIDDDGDYLVVQHRLNEKLVLHAASMNTFAQLQRSYLFFSDHPFVQVKAGFDNFIKFPLVRVQHTEEAL